VKLTAQREQLLRYLQQVNGVIERRQTLPILSNVLLAAKADKLVFTATDLEVELSAETQLSVQEPGDITLPARKFLDILRALPEETVISLAAERERMLIRSGRSRFNLATLPAADFPTLEDLPLEGHIHLQQSALRNLIEHTYFSMAQQDVRYYLNGLLFDMDGDRLRAIATDGHRLAFGELMAQSEIPLTRQLIVPRKGVQELLRLLSGHDDAAAVLQISTNHIRAILGEICFTSKLIDGKFPDYHRVIPRDSDRVIIADRLLLRNALSRAAILSNEKYRGVRLQLEARVLRIQAQNPEQEEAEEELEIEYDGDPLEIGFNVTYLLDALGALSSESVKICLADSTSSCLIQEPENKNYKYVIMPMRL
jgi:DNA polymerase-3 subunit beta